ncbi:MAG: peptide chain release factor 2, partial [Oscillospiraceae bacterium]
MLQIEELRLSLQAMRPDIDDLAEAIGYQRISEQVEELEEKAAMPGFWDDLENSQKIVTKTKQLKDTLAEYDSLVREYDDTATLIEIAQEEQDDSLAEEIKAGCDRVAGKLEEMKLATLLTGPYDANNAIMTFHAGAGGTEAQDWAQMLYRMYARWTERHGFTYKLLDYLEGDEAGIKSASVLVQGHNAYGFLKSENGVHRLVRVS